MVLISDDDFYEVYSRRKYLSTNRFNSQGSNSMCKLPLINAKEYKIFEQCTSISTKCKDHKQI